MTEAEIWQRVFALAEKGRYGTSPNPRVGAVLVDPSGRLVAEGFHARAGHPHAEAAALAAAGASAKGTSLFLNLEPCAHHGRTPPCADALIAAGVSRVVCSMEDPDPLVAGQGLHKLRAAGIAVAAGLLETEARELNVGFVSRMTRGRPWLRLKIAASLD